MNGAPQLAVVGRAVRLDARAELSWARTRIGDRFGDHVDHAAQRVRPVQHARGTANHLHAVGEARIGRWAVLVAPRVVLQTPAVIEHQHTRPREPANHRLADLSAGRQRANPGDVGKRVRQGHAGTRVHAAAVETRGRQR